MLQDISTSAFCTCSSYFKLNKQILYLITANVITVRITVVQCFHTMWYVVYVILKHLIIVHTVAILLAPP